MKRSANLKCILIWLFSLRFLQMVNFYTQWGCIVLCDGLAYKCVPLTLMFWIGVPFYNHEKCCSLTHLTKPTTILSCQSTRFSLTYFKQRKVRKTRLKKSVNCTSAKCQTGCFFFPVMQNSWIWTYCTWWTHTTVTSQAHTFTHVL